MSWVETARDWLRGARFAAPARPRIGLALGGGFARGIAHVGVLRVLERAGIPVDAIAGVSAGSIVASAYASGASPDEIEAVGRTMKFSDVARWTVSRHGLAGSERMSVFLTRLLRVSRFEDMRIPLAVVASDLCSGKPVVFQGRGDVVLPIRASCSYPGLFLPICDGDRWLVDGMVAMEVPAAPLRQMGATRVISVGLPSANGFDGGNMMSVINRCFQVMSRRTEREWRRASDLVIEPRVSHVGWDGFASAKELIEAGERAAEAALPMIRGWLEGSPREAVVPVRAVVESGWLG